MIATFRSEGDKEIASRAGADEVLLTGESMAKRVRALAPDGANHIVEVAFGADINTDMEVLAQGGSIATYATNAPTPKIPFWQLGLSTPESSSSAAMTCLPTQRSKPLAISIGHLRRVGRG